MNRFLKCFFVLILSFPFLGHAKKALRGHSHGHAKIIMAADASKKQIALKVVGGISYRVVL